MKKTLFILFATLLSAVSLSAENYLPARSLRPAPAHSTVNMDEPIITIHTNRYETYGAENNFQFNIMASIKAKQTQIEVDFGFGRKSYTVGSTGSITEDEENEVITGGTLIAGSVSPAGVVRVYGDASQIDYFDCHGGEVTDIDLSAMTQLSILELGHNAIHELHLDNMPYLEYLDVKDNPFDKGFYIGKHDALKYLNINMLGDHALDHCDGVIDLTKLQALNFFMAWDSHCLRAVDPSQCKYLIQLSIDNTSVSTLDVTNNANLLILNISDTRINSIDLSGNTKLVEFYAANEGQSDPAAKLHEIDFSHNTYLQRIFLDGNALTTVDVSKQWNLISLYAANNLMTSITGVDIEIEPADRRPRELAYLDISGNYFNYATLPIVKDSTYFYYELQHDLPVAKEYGVGEKGRLDLSKYIVRKGTANAVQIATLARDGFTATSILTEGVDYTFDGKVITFLTAHTDSVQVAIYNDFFTDVILRTTCFLVRSAEDYGKPVERMSLTPAAGGDITFSVTTSADETLSVDFGDGSRKDFTTKAHTATEITGKATGRVIVYGRVASMIEALSIENQPLKALDVDKMTGMRNLSVKNCDLPSIDLGWNNLLRTIDLTGNHLDTLSLTGVNNAFNKNLLVEVKVPNNDMHSLDLGLAAATIITIDASGNSLSAIALDDMYMLRTLNLANNNLAQIDLSECGNLIELDLTNNNLRELDLTTNDNLKVARISGNRFTFSSLDEVMRDGIVFTYAPQQPMHISPITIAVNLPHEALIRGKQTTFAWREQGTDTLLMEGKDYTYANGKTTFAAEMKGHHVYAEMTNPAFPDFTGENVLRTTVTEPIDAPKYEVASFTTPVGKQRACLSLAATEAETYIYIDWGDGGLIEYQLGRTYTLFGEDSLTLTIPNGHVRVYSNVAENGKLSVFSIWGISMTDVVVNKMTDLVCLSLEGAGISAVDLNGLQPKLRELKLARNKFTSIDLTGFLQLNYVLLAANELTSVKLDPKNKIEWIYLDDNKLTTIDNIELGHAFELSANRNQLTGIDMSRIPNVGQLWLSGNQLHAIDISATKYLNVLDITNNRFDFSTLPNPDDLNVFNYGGQAPLDVKCVNGVIDLTSQMKAWDVPSEIFFFEGPIQLYEDEEGNIQLMNPEFDVDIDFYNKGGLISFEEDWDAVTGLVVNELYPNLLLYTKTIPVKGIHQDVESVMEDAAPARKCIINGHLIIERDGRRYSVLGAAL